MKKSDFGVVLMFQDGSMPNIGEGVSRPKATDKTTMHRVEVKIQSSAPMRVTLPAATPEDALKFAQNRWPNATCKLC